jgi:hypothetical protein
VSISRQCSCYHEAGHAVAWVVNGYSLRLVVGHSAAVLSPDKQSVWDEPLGDPNNLPVYLTRLQKRARSGGRHGSGDKESALFRALQERLQ